jgi:hypothetical protein
VPEQDIAALGPAQGPAVPVHCPIRDSLRRVLLWFVLLVLMLRKPNRTRQAWTLVLVLGALSLLLHAAEGYVNAHVVFYLHRHICTVICELLQALAMALAVLLAMSDLIALRHRLLRFLLVFFILFEAGAVAILPNAPVVLSTGVWIAVFGFFLLVFMIGHAILQALLRVCSDAGRRFFAGRASLRQAPPEFAPEPLEANGNAQRTKICPDGHTTNLLAWSAALSLLLGAGPLVAFAIIGSILSRSLQLQSTLEYFRLAVTLSQALLGPYFVLSWFLLLALFVPLYRERLSRCFGYPAGIEKVRR